MPRLPTTLAGTCAILFALLCLFWAHSYRHADAIAHAHAGRYIAIGSIPGPLIIHWGYDIIHWGNDPNAPDGWAGFRFTTSNLKSRIGPRHFDISPAGILFPYALPTTLSIPPHALDLAPPATTPPRLPRHPQPRPLPN